MNFWYPKVVINVGGVRESLNARPGVYKLCVQSRKGFIRLALETGAWIVPVFSFNEVELYNQVHNEPGSNVRKFQDFVKRITSGSFPFLIGRGPFGLFPFTAAITTVVGHPIQVTKNLTPSEGAVDRLHQKFVTALKVLFETHKSTYISNAENIKLELE
jgi:2-acylglycerol O-acyltransferase 2